MPSDDETPRSPSQDISKPIKRRKIKCPCGNRAWYGLRGDVYPSRCEKCKTCKMGLLRDRFCFCGKQANFGYDNDNKLISCKACSRPGMINLKYGQLKGCLSPEKCISQRGSPTKHNPHNKIAKSKSLGDENTENTLFSKNS